MRSSAIRKVVRLLILESTSVKGYKMIFLAGLPGGGKSTLLDQLGIENQFTNCNIDNFFEPRLQDDLGTMDLHTPTERYVTLKRKVRDEGYQMTPSEQNQYDLDSAIVSKGASLFSSATNEFKKQVGEVCSIGSNFIVDGTSANYGRTSKDMQKYLDMGYDCAMIMVDIDVETSQERNLARGAKGKRSIWNSLIYRQSKSMTPNLEKYAALFGPDRFFLVSNKGSFDEYKENIESIRPQIEQFMRE
jgi:predicted kinase